MHRGAQHAAAAVARPPPSPLPLGVSQRLKEGDDAPGVIALWLTRAAGPARQRLRARGGRWLARGLVVGP
jgi:hypothetical protein